MMTMPCYRADNKTFSFRCKQAKTLPDCVEFWPRGYTTRRVRTRTTGTADDGSARLCISQHRKKMGQLRPHKVINPLPETDLQSPSPSSLKKKTYTNATKNFVRRRHGNTLASIFRKPDNGLRKEHFVPSNAPPLLTFSTFADGCI